MGKTVLVTGANRGIGAAVARRFARAGYDVALGLRDETSIERGGAEVLADCRAAGVRAEVFLGDVGDFSTCGRMVEEVVRALGGIDVLVNNAGITRDSLLVRMDESRFDEVMQANLKSVFNMTRHITPLMMKKRSGHIVNVASVAGVYGNAGQANYSASKAGVIALTKTIAKELGARGVICNAVAPGPVESDMTDTLPDRVRERMLSSISLGRFARTEEIADTVLFLAETTIVTGQVLVADGGMGF